MANPITGDFDAVLQVSGSTVNRLLASIHQNGGPARDPDLPAFPHSVSLRIGEPRPIGGMRGTAWAQVSVPHLELVHGSSDRFWLEVGVRARYKPDARTTPLPEFIHGTIRAQYRIEDIDPNCRGWRHHASEYLWIRVIGDTVSFRGTAVDDLNIFSVVPGIDPAVADARITHLARVLLQTRFAATPHKVSTRFRRGSMRSLNVGLNRSLVAVPMPLGPIPATARIDSITQELLDGRDFAIAISKEFIVSRIQPILDDVRKKFRLEYRVRHTNPVLKVDITWGITLQSATVRWAGGLIPFVGLSAGMLVVTASGQARTEKSIFNWDFSATHHVLVTFDSVAERFNASPFGTPIVRVTGSFGAVVEPYARPEIEKAVANETKNAIAQLGDELNLKSPKEQLVEQLKSIDADASAAFTGAEFTPDGAIVRGAVGLSARHGATHHFAPSGEQDGYTAFESWIPGGRVDSHEWSWSWAHKGMPGGNYAGKDRFLLRRPTSGSPSRFGVGLGSPLPLPGFDGMGTVCLNVHGVQVHPVNGQLVATSTERRCRRFGFDVAIHAGIRVLVRERAPGPRDPIGPVAEVALVDVAAQPGAPASNTLVVYAPDEWQQETANTLRTAVATSERLDAGLLVVVLFRDGRLEQPTPDLLRQLEELAAELEAPLMVNEDVRGTWSTALAIEPDVREVQWRLVSPTGGLTWMHSGTLAAYDLRQTLDGYMFPSGPARPNVIVPTLKLGERVSSMAADLGLIGVHLEEEEPLCPPPPPGTVGIKDVIFIQTHSRASQAVLRRALSEESEEGRDDATVLAIVDGAGDRDIEELSRAHPDGLLAIGDTDGRLARRLGIRVWPTRVSVNDDGVITRVDEGANAPESGHTPEAS